ncbi:hypothetical protein H9L39_15367 [Fusarium oxysporum f. sp. albedinis]|nr:hypothetical protein H9L39_15367 [Fusarium oxysporum f. sp. albedinis]
MFSPRGIASILVKAPSDVVILSSLRTPICRANRGSLKDAFPEELLASVLKATIDGVPNLDPSIIEDVAVGVVLYELGGSKAAHSNKGDLSGNWSGYGKHDTELGSRAIPTDIWPALRESPVKDALDCILPMDITSENVAERYGISREDQDTFAVNSHLKAAEARAFGLFSDEIVPVTQKKPDGLGEVVVDTDDGIRPQASSEGLAKLKPAFRENGTSTAAKELGLSGNIMGKFVSAVTVGCAPDEMGVGPVIAIPKLLDSTGLTKDDVHRWEINEAFASQAIYCLRKPDVERAYQNNKFNPNGGAIALGHPLGATGARLTSTLLHG